MRVLTVQHLLLVPVGGMLALALAGCSETTYGTGVSPEKQTLTDVMSIASLNGNSAPPIHYKPRGNVVMPPTTTLPVPGQAAVASNDPNWPKDPDALKRQEDEQDSDTPIAQPAHHHDNPNVPNMVLAPGQTSFSNSEAQQAAQSKAEGQKAWDALHKSKGGSYDSAGNPTRKYLTEPPVAYREGDPNAPMTEPVKPKKKFSIWPFN